MGLTKVIVVDDDPDSAHVLGEYLQIKGIEVLGYAYNGKQAVSLYKKVKPDVVLMDLVMIGYDGYYGMEKIRAHDKSAKVIMVTGSVTPSGAELLQKHASAVVLKPIDIDKLLQAINRVMGKIKTQVAEAKSKTRFRQK